MKGQTGNGAARQKEKYDPVLTDGVQAGRDCNILLRSGNTWANNERIKRKIMKEQIEQQETGPVKVWEKRTGKIEMFTNVYRAIRANGSVRLSYKWSDCLEFINGHKVQVA